MQIFHEKRQYKDGFQVWYGQYRNMSFYAHWHDEIELMYIREGQTIVHMYDRTFTAKAGDLLICSGGIVHYSEDASTANRIEFITFSGALVGISATQPPILYPMFTYEMLKNAELNNLIDATFSLIKQELSEHKPYYKEIINSQLNCFWNHLKRKFPQFETQYDVCNHSHYLHQSMQNLLSYINEHYNEHITLTHAAEILNFTESHASRVFTRYMGMGFNNYLTRIRIEKSMILMLETSMRMSDIAFSCGFGSVRSFNRAFKQITGATPKDFHQSGRITDFLLTHNPKTHSNEANIENDSLVVKQAPHNN